MAMESPSPPPPAWVVLLTFVIAAFAILVTSIFAGLLLHSLDPDVPPIEALRGIRGLIAGALASSTALVFTLAVASRGLTLARLRLVPGRETGLHLVVAIVGVLAFGQALDSATVLVGLADRGSVSVIRKALLGVSGSDLFLAVVTIGLFAGAAEEVFFRGYMQSMLRERWRPWMAIAVTSFCFGALHLDVVHGPLAALLGLYLGFVADRTGSALPAIACHVVNNVVYTILTAVIGSFGGRGLQLALGAASAVVFVACVAWLRHSLPRSSRC
jgi:membrane protease YdiL (CAAX protease family)